MGYERSLIKGSMATEHPAFRLTGYVYVGAESGLPFDVLVQAATEEGAQKIAATHVAATVGVDPGMVSFDSPRTGA